MRTLLLEFVKCFDKEWNYVIIYLPNYIGKAENVNSFISMVIQFFYIKNFPILRF